MTNEARKAAMRRRTKAFAAAVIRFYCSLDLRREELRVVGKQLLRAGTSVGANYREASRARSTAEFVAKVELCAQEADDGAERRRWRRVLLPAWKAEPATGAPWASRFTNADVVGVGHGGVRCG